jgi:hypothetical protein
MRWMPGSTHLIPADRLLDRLLGGRAVWRVAEQHVTLGPHQPARVVPTHRHAHRPQPEPVRHQQLRKRLLCSRRTRIAFCTLNEQGATGTLLLNAGGYLLHIMLALMYENLGICFPKETIPPCSVCIAIIRPMWISIRAYVVEVGLVHRDHMGVFRKRMVEALAVRHHNVHLS